MCTFSYVCNMRTVVSNSMCEILFSIECCLHSSQPPVTCPHTVRHLLPGISVPTKTLKQMFYEVDVDNRGFITFKQFANAVGFQLVERVLCTPACAYAALSWEFCFSRVGVLTPVHTRIIPQQSASKKPVRRAKQSKKFPRLVRPAPNFKTFKAPRAVTPQVCFPLAHLSKP